MKFVMLTNTKRYNNHVLGLIFELIDITDNGYKVVPRKDIIVYNNDGMAINKMFDYVIISKDNAILLD